MNDEPKMAVIPAGSLFTVSTGEYDEYTVMGVFRATGDIDPNALRDEWLAAHPDESSGHKFMPHSFLADAARRGLCEAVPSFEWHLCDYCRVSKMWVETP